MKSIIAGGVKIYFYAVFDKEFASYGIYENNAIKPDISNGTEGKIKIYKVYFY